MTRSSACRRCFPARRARARPDRRGLRERTSRVRCVGPSPTCVVTAPPGGFGGCDTLTEDASLLLAVLVAGPRVESDCAGPVEIREDCRSQRRARCWRGPAGGPVRLTGSFGLVTAVRCGVVRVQLGHQTHKGQGARPGAHGLPSPSPGLLPTLLPHQAVPRGPFVDALSPDRHLPCRTEES